MTRVNRVTIDEKGNVHLDLSGYVGEECQVEERRFRRILAELGLRVEVKGLYRKTPEEIMAETQGRAGQGQGRRIEL